MAFARRPAKNKTPINRSPCTRGSPPGRYVDPPRWRWRSWRSRQSKPASYVCSQLFPPTPFPSCEDSTLQALCPTKGERTTKGRLFCVTSLCFVVFLARFYAKPHSPPLRGGVARSAGVVSSAKSRGCRTDHPVCDAAVASRHLICGAATPPLRGGEYLFLLCFVLLPLRGGLMSIVRIAALILIAGTIAAQQPPAQPAQPAQPAEPAARVAPVLENYKPVTAERLKKPEDGDWLMVRRTYDGWGYSPLEQVTTKNVQRLFPVWEFSTGMVSGHEAPPIVNNGVMFVATPGNQVIAIEAKTGKLLWRFRRPLAEGAIVPHATTRGLALYADKVFFAAGEAVLVAIEAKTGKEVWAAKIEENKNGYYTTMAPLAVDGKVFVGASGGEFGIRGFIAAFDADTGKELWRTFTVPAPGEPGSETWPKGDQWKNGGGSVWMTPNYDPESYLLFVGTGNGGSWIGDKRPGDNLYTA